MNKNIPRTNTQHTRCAIYTRKSTEEGLDMEFNSLDAQRESCEAYILSQKAEGWQTLATQYDDGGFSGKDIERPAFQRLLKDIKSGQIDLVVVYKIDRLSRSLLDFVKMIEMFYQYKVTFVSVTQAFNTSTSMGRLMMNVLMSFAQFERETISERIRDKHAASRRKGIWMGGVPPFGYDVIKRKLIINKPEAKIVRGIFKAFISSHSCIDIVRDLRDKKQTTKQWTTQKGTLRKGKTITKQFIHRILNNRIYLGEAVHKTQSFPGEHKAIIDPLLWEEAHRILGISPKTRGNATRASRPAALLKGFVRCACCGSAMTPSSTSIRARGQSYRYYVCSKTLKLGKEACNIRSIGAEELESAVMYQIKEAFKAPQLIGHMARLMKDRDTDCEILTQRERERFVRSELKDFDALWDELFIQEQRKLLGEMLKEVTVSEEGIRLILKEDNLTNCIKESLDEEEIFERGNQGHEGNAPASNAA